MRGRRAWLAGTLLLGALGASGLICLLIGAVPLSLAALWDAVRGQGEETTQVILWELRLPRVLTAVMVGGVLGCVGCAFQGLLRNPLADPYIVGVSSGAAVGAAVGVLLGWHMRGWGWAIALLAFGGGLLTLMLALGLSRQAGQLRIPSFLLVGVSLSASLWGVITLLLTLAGEDLSRVIYWLLGGLLNADWARLWGASVPALVGCALLLAQARALNLYTAGEETAQHLGAPVERLKWVVLVGGALATAATVSIAGVIGFVGWMTPHLLRRVVGGDHRALMPLSALGGALLLLWADTLARTLARPVELPVGVITALIGAPLFLWVMRSETRAG
ncbi:MAG: corrinoid ABC transporter permease [Fimbriimonadales bacterium]|nr:MAG: corrinoid ABC transporter permease [Fimbriimonadales bacterium]